MCPCYHRSKTPSLGPLLRDMPDLTPTLVLSLRACRQSPRCDGNSDRLRRDLRVGTELCCRCRHLRRRLDWSPRLDRGLRSVPDRQDRTDTFIVIISDLYQDHEKSSMELGGSMLTSSSSNREVFLDSDSCSSSPLPRASP